jgi:hypothetical protein
MNDITKARFFLKGRASNLEGLQSFGLMLATAERNYREVRLHRASNAANDPAWEEKEAEAALDYALLKYLKKHNQLPKDAVLALTTELSLEQKKVMAQRWATA